MREGEAMNQFLSKRLLGICALIALVWVPVAAFAAVSGSEKQASVAEEQGTDNGGDAQKKSKTKKKSTEVSFDDVLVQGKYHFSDEAVTTVEQDKVLDALLGVRTDFKDRLKKSASRH